MTTSKKKYSNKRKPVKRRRTKRNWRGAFVSGIVVLGMVAVTFFVAMALLSTKRETEPVIYDTSSEDFIAALVPHAKRIQERHGVLPSIIIGQAILESDWGTSELGRDYYNLFGIKAYGDGEKVSLKTKEFSNDKWIEISADFKVYPNWEASMDDHAALFVNGVTWNPQLYQEVLHAKDYRQAATALQAAGYATDPDYANKIIGVIEGYELQQYD